MLDEAELSRMLDEVYAGGLADEFLRDVTHHERTFVRRCLDDLRAFQSDDNLAEQFDQLFDGIEVVPVVLVPEFMKALSESVIDAHGFLVPIRYVQLARFRRAGRAQRIDGGFIAVDAQYDDETGLQISEE
ncbi:MAG: hypothetical protein C4345_14315 [Chloroflexota bacterium]